MAINGDAQTKRQENKPLTLFLAVINFLMLCISYISKRYFLGHKYLYGYNSFFHALVRGGCRDNNTRRYLYATKKKGKNILEKVLNNNDC